MYPEGQRRSPFPDDYQFRHQHHPDQGEFYHRRSPPHHDGMHYKKQRLSPLDDGGFDMERERRGFREHSQRFEKRGVMSQSPPQMTRGFPSTQRSHSDHRQREMGPSWRREGPDRGQGRFRDFTPSMRSGEHRAGDRERGRRTPQGPDRGRQRENPHHERGPPFKRPRREMDSADHFGYRDEEDFGGKGFSVDTPRGGFKGGTRGNLTRGGIRHSGPLDIDHGRGITDSREPSQWEPFEDRRRHYPEFDRHRSPRSMDSLQERFRPSDSRLDDREGTLDYHFKDDLGDPNYHETRRNSAPQDRPNTTKYGNGDGPMNHRGRGGVRRRYDQGRGGRIEHPRNQPRVQQSSQGYQDLPCEEQRPEHRPFRDDFGESFEEESNWEEKGRLQQWKQNRSGSLDRQRDDLNPKMSRQREHGWNSQKPDNMTVVTEETLTIKVDMSRPANQNSLLCYSSDRQLSLDLVNVGRQRLDFLPMLEHSGTYQETAMHTGTFAQEIITLVHLVKEQYFRGDGVTLNERFSAPQGGGYSEGEPEEMTLSQRFSSNRGFSLNMESLLDDDDEPLFSRMGPMQGLRKQPLRGPGDLRHDLERRRQEKLEGVQVTIPGNSLPQSSMEPVSESDRLSPMDHEGFSNWSRGQNRRREGNFGPRGGPSNRLNMGPQRRNSRFGNQRHDMHSSPTGPTW
ncbi:BCLAF1 and THRAP3 family member 3 isoform X2 [Melanotaenia boesemani]|nr:BCLAF1 and THRAP3 family member 3 isoform X2 [Melanotaenia boesemani]